MSDIEVRLMIATRMADALNRLLHTADDLAHDDELNFGDLAQALNEALELASTAVRQLDRELRDNGEPDAGPSLRQVSLPSVQDWMDEVL